MARISIRASILQTFAALIVLTVAGVSLVFYFGSKTLLVDLFNRLAQRASERIVERTTAFLELPGQHVELAARTLQDTAIVENHERIWQLLWHQLMLTPQAASIYVADRQGSFVQVRRTPRLATRLIDRTVSPARERWVYRDADYRVLYTETRTADFDPRLRDWYRQGIGQTEIHWSEVYRYHSTGELGLTAAFSIRTGDGSPGGVAGVDLTLQRLTEFVTSQRLHQTGALLIIDADGRVVTPTRHTITENPSATELPSIAEAAPAWLADAYRAHRSSGKSLLFSVTEGKRFLAGFFEFPEGFPQGWKIAAVLPEAEVLGPVRRVVTRAVAVAILILALSLAVIFVAAGLISRPVKQLATEAERIRDLRLEAVQGVQTRLAEIRRLNDAFIAMKNGLAAFRRYVPSELVRDLIASGQEARLGGERRQLAILFTDVVGFTPLAESSPAETLLRQLSEYMEKLTRIIQKEDGTVDKYIGDGIMAFWGAPRRLDRPALHACRAALQCRDAAAALNRRWDARSQSPLPTCMGLHFGETIVGNFGAENRMNYSVFGDSVNLASRLEGLNRVYGTEIIISSDVLREVGAAFLSRPLDIVAVKGKRKRIRIYELVDERGAGGVTWKSDFCRRFGRAFELYLQRRWDEALALFEALHREDPGDAPVRIYIDRCRKYRDAPGQIPPDWDGTTVLTEK
jgi:adenylate cyclase